MLSWRKYLRLGEILRFCSAGLLNTAFTVAVYQLLLRQCGPVLAYSMAWLSGLLIVAIGYPKAVYRAEASVARRVQLVFIYAAMFLVGVVSTSVMQYSGVPPRLIVFIVAALTATGTYLGGRHLLGGAEGWRRPIGVLNSTRLVWAGPALIVVMWLCWLGSLYILQRLGYTYGFQVWPLGEDRNWVSILQKGAGTHAADLFWSINDRNPLSPWWYIAFSKYILGLEPALLLLRYLTGLLLALSTYAMVAAIDAGRSRIFGLGLALVVLLFMANGYLDQIYWNFQAALVCSVLSVTYYARFLRDSRRDYRLYGISLTFWFIAIASYTIQSGAVIAIAYLAFTRENAKTRTLLQNLRRRVVAVIVDCLPFMAVFLVFLLIWRTTTLHPQTYSLDPNFERFLRSLEYGLWHYDLQGWLSALANGAPAVAYVSALIIAVAVFLIMRLLPQFVAAERAAATIASPRLILDVVIVVLLLSVPTVIVETAGGPWLPGFRWRMIYQLTTPTLYLSAVGLFLWPIRMPKVQRLGWAFTVALFGGVAVLVSLLANQSQVRITQSEKRLRSAMADVLAKKLFAGSPGPFYFLVKRSPNYTWYSSDALSQVYAETWFPQYDVSFRFIPDRPIDSPYAQMWPIRFGSDGQGLGNAKLWGVTVPYAQVSMLQATAEKISTITALRSQDIAGLWAIWDRKDDDILDLPIAGGSPCPLDWSADHPAMMSGWRGAERDAIGAFRWTVTRRADIRLPLGCAGAARISVTVAFAASEANLLGLRLSVNGSPISLVRTASKEGQKFSGVIPPGVLKPSKSDLIRLSIPKLVTIGGQGLGVAVRNLQISPLGAEQ